MRKIGFRNFLIQFNILEGLCENNYVILKNKILKIGNNVWVVLDEINGENVILNDVVVSFGNVKNGFIIRYKLIVNK